LALPVELEKREPYSLWTGADLEKPVIVVADGSLGDRLRLSIAYELGHLVMHLAPKGDLKTIKREAYRFAGELLMLEQGMRDELLPPVTLTSLATLKSRWGVSMGALAQRARDLEIITPRQFTYYLHKQLSKRGWHSNEPPNLAVPIERPRAVRKMAELLYGSPIDYKRLASDTNLT
jgi:Zn-dependent peptidase ImmA (M78 family)